MRQGLGRLILAGAAAGVFAGPVPALGAGSATGGAAPTGTLPASGASSSGTPVVSVVQTAPSLGQYLARLTSLRLRARRPRGRRVVVMDSNVRYQQVTGFGGAMTDSSAWLIGTQLSSKARAQLIRELFSASGIALNYLRVPMGASDFSAQGRPYSYDDRPHGQTDPTLSHFSIAHDQAYIIPVLRAVRAVQPKTFIIANPWSAPPWMKANDAFDNVGRAGVLLRLAYRSLARYFVKFIQAYGRRGLRVNAVTPQNEPGVAARYPGMELSEPDEVNFIRHYLRPALVRAGLSTEIFGNDLSWDEVRYASPLARSPAASALAGISWHCYFGSPTAMSAVHAQAPSLTAIVNECSPEIRSFSTASLLVDSLRNWASGVAVWNLALDPQGGPVEPPNSGCRSCNGIATVDPASRSATLSLKYYQFGQISKYVHPGAVRVASNTFVSAGVNRNDTFIASSGLDDVAFVNPDGQKVLVAYNTSSRALPFAVSWQGHSLSYQIPAGAMTTFRWR